MKKLAYTFTLFVLSVCFSMPTMAQTGLAGWWQGESNVLDSIGTNNGAIVMQLSYVPGLSSQAFDFTGGSIDIPDNPTLHPTNITIQMYVKSSGSGGYKYLASKALAGTFGLYTGGEGTIHFFCNTPSGQAFSAGPNSPGAIWDNNWHQLTAVFDGTYSLVYIDGVLQTNKANGYSDLSGSGPANLSYPAGDLILGDYAAAYGATYTGLMDDVRVFNHALTASDIMDTYTNPVSPALTAGLISWYKADGNANDSVGINNGKTVASVFAYSPGKFGTGFFPQGGDAAIPDAPALDPVNVTLQAWVKSVSPGLYDYIACKVGAASGQSYALYTGGDGGAYFFVNLAGAGVYLSPEATPPQIWDGAWHLLTGTFDGSAVNLYVDGFAVGSGTSVPAGYNIDYSNPGPLVFGSYRAAGGGNFIGQMDEVKLCSQALSPQEVLAEFAGTNLVSWWQANNNANDSVGANNGTLLGSVTFSAGRLSGYAFDTSGGAVKIPDSPSLHVTNITLEAMINAAQPETNKYIISKSDTASAASYALFTGPNGGLTFSINTGSGVVVSPVASTAVWDGNYHLVDGVFDGQAVHLYVDGAEVGSGTSASGQIQYGNSQSSGELLFGDYTDSLSISNFAGEITSVKLYNTALHAQDIFDDAAQTVLVLPLQNQAVNQGSTVTFKASAQGPPPLSYQWQFYGTNLVNQTNSALVLSNVTASSAGSYDVVVNGGTVKYVPGVAGNAFNFNAGGLVRINDSDRALDLQAFTLQTYVRGTSPGNYKWLMFKSRDPVFHGASYGLYTGGDGKLYAVVTLGPTSSLADVLAGPPSTNIWDGNWHQVTATWDGEFLSLYVDGALIQTVDSFGGTIDYETYSLNGDLLLGDSGGLPSPFHFPGAMDEVKFFNVSLTADQVADTYTNSASTSATNGLVSWWKGENNALDSWGTHNGLTVPPPGAVMSPATLTVVASQAVLGQLGVSGGNFQGSVTGPNGQTYVVQRATSLTTGSWVPIYTNTVPFTFMDPINGGGTIFYRAVSQ